MKDGLNELVKLHEVMTSYNHLRDSVVSSAWTKAKAYRFEELTEAEFSVLLTSYDSHWRYSDDYAVSKKGLLLESVFESVDLPKDKSLDELLAQDFRLESDPDYRFDKSLLHSLPEAYGMYIPAAKSRYVGQAMTFIKDVIDIGINDDSDLLAYRTMIDAYTKIDEYVTGNFLGSKYNIALDSPTLKDATVTIAYLKLPSDVRTDVSRFQNTFTRLETDYQDSLRMVKGLRREQIKALVRTGSAIVTDYSLSGIHIANGYYISL